MPGVLTRELVIARSKVDNLSAIKSLNAWGNDIEDVQILKQLPNVEVLSLSVNRISSLRDFSRCHKLQELYLRKNNIENLGELQHIANLPVLRVLWLNENPCANAKNYREKVIKMLPCLMKLDDQPITNDERRLANQVELEAFEEVAEEHAAEIDLYFSPIEQQKQQYLYEQQIDRNEIPIKALKNRNIKPWSNKRTAANTPKAKKQEVFGEYSSSEREKMATPPSGEKENRNSASKSEYLVSAVLNLLEVLDLSSLEFLKEDIEKKISIRKMSP